jgi:hypothetical protein
MPTNRLRVINVEVDEMGQVTRLLPKLDREEQLDHSLLCGLFPEARLARVTFPQNYLDLVQQSKVLPAMEYFEVDGIRYRAVGGTKTFYGIEEKYEPFIQKRFKASPQLALTSFGILVSECKFLAHIPDLRLGICDDLRLGTNDSRGYISRSLFNQFDRQHQTALFEEELRKLWMAWKEKLPADHRDDPVPDEIMMEWSRQAERKVRNQRIPSDRFYQFRLAFKDGLAKGGCKIMEDDVAEELGFDMILPKSCFKPPYEGGEEGTVPCRDAAVEVTKYQGSAFFGIREFSYEGGTQKGSYTLLQFAPWKSIQSEMASLALSQVEKLKSASTERRYDEVLELLGNSRATRVSELEIGSQYTSKERTAWEALLKVDPTGYMIGHPWVNGALNRALADWTFHLCTAAGMEMPAFHLCDDGFLALCNGKVVCASDWIPQNRAITSVQCKKGLVVRYPVRMFEDLLPYTPMSTDECVTLMSAVIAEQVRCPVDRDALARLFLQVATPGTLVLSSLTFKLFGGDGDGDRVGVIRDDEFPLFVESRFQHQCRPYIEKSKDKKRESPWWELASLANQSKGNQIGPITNLIARCVAADMKDEAYLLVGELQNALDALKWGTEVDRKLVSSIRDNVPDVPWLGLKDKDRVSDMPKEFKGLSPTDKIGWLYNLVRKHIEEFFPPKRPISDFFSVISGEEITEEIVESCLVAKRFWAGELIRLRETRERLQESADRAKEEYTRLKAAHKQSPNVSNPALDQARRRFYATQAAVAANKKRQESEYRDICDVEQSWADGITENRRAYCQAMHMVLCRGKGNGGLMFRTFGQEFVDMYAEKVGSTPVEIFTPKLLTGKVEFIDGNVFFIERVPNDDGSFLEERHYLQTLPLDGYSEGEIREGTIILNDIRQRLRIQRKEAKSKTFSASVSPVQPSSNTNPSDRESQQLSA